MTRKTLTRARCGFTIRRDLATMPGCRGVHETPAEFGACPRGCGPMTHEAYPAFEAYRRNPGYLRLLAEAPDPRGRTHGSRRRAEVPRVVVSPEDLAAARLYVSLRADSRRADATDPREVDCDAHADGSGE